MKLGFVIIAHDNPGNAARLARLLLESGSTVCIHYDLKGGERPVAEIRERLGELAGKLIWADRVRVAWGEWSIVAATLNAVKAMFASGAEPDYIHLMSATDYPIRPISDFAGFLERHNGTDFIESHDIDRNWVKGGLSKERYQYRHYFNFKKHPKLFTACWRTQALLKLRRKPPAGLKMRMGSQWCTLTGESWKRILARSADRKIRNFFETSWIPDEMYAQTLLSGSTAPHSNRHLTLYQFNDYGVPIVYYDNHLEYLSRQPFFFARKLSGDASGLRNGLDALVEGTRTSKQFGDAAIGKPTDEYETFRRLYRHGAKGVRIPGHVKDPWYGDLEWNLRPYVAVLGTSSEELEQIASILDTVGGLVCHRFLFAGDHIGFAGGQERLAGYSRHDVLLRDHKRTNFLVDIIESNPGKTTCFLALAGEENKLLDVICWDRNARIIFVRGGMLHGFAEHLGGLATEFDGDEKSARGMSVSQHFTSYSDWHQTLETGQIAAYRNGKAQFAEIDIMEPGWRNSLARILKDIGHDSLGADSVGGRMRPVEHRRRLHLPASLLPDILSAAQSHAGRNRLISEIMAQPKPPYAVILGLHRHDGVALAEALRATGHFWFVAAPPANAEASLLALTAGGAGKPKVLVLGPEDGAAASACLGDPDARPILMAGSPERAAAERFQSTAHPGTTEHIVGEPRCL